MSRRRQRRSGTVITAAPVLASGASTIRLGCVNITTVGGMAAGKAKSRSAAPRVTWM